MKRKSVVLLVSVLMAGCLAFGASTLAQSAAAEEEGYSVSGFAELPADWQLNDQCDAENTSVTFENGDMVIRSEGSTSPQKYYGAMYFIDKDSVYEDFTFEITVKMTDPADTSRWLGIMYHTRTTDTNTIGYLMNYRYNGNSASSAVDAGRNFYDDAVSTGNPALSDGEYHTLKITLCGTTARHYVDGRIIKEWDVASKNDKVGGAPLTSGGFALLLNRATLNIKSCSISRGVEAEEPEAPGIFGDALPENWELYGESDVAHTASAFENGDLVITHNNAAINNQLYYGSVYLIDTDAAYSDFTFEITVKMTDPFDASRWFGVMYHTQKVGSNLVGYLMNYRYNGQTASSAVDASRGFSDDEKDRGNALSDGLYHTMKIEMAGTTAKHYMDGVLIKEWDVKTKDDTLGGTLKAGGFALLLNRATLSVKNYSVSGTPAKIAEADGALVETYRAESAPTNAPTVVFDVKDKAALDSLKADGERPSNAILRFDKDYNIVAADGAVLDSFTNIYTNVLRGRIIPVLHLADEGAADAALKYFEEEADILDLAVMSENPSLVKKVKEANGKIRGIVSYAAGTNLYEIVKTTNMSYANVAVIPQSMATQENVRYIQARFKTVWVTADDTAGLGLYDCVNSGAYGVIVSDFSAAYDVLETYAKNGLSRMPFNAAHRGLPKLYNENSVSGVKAAIAAGATHVELDGYLTTDNHIVLMHDNTIDRTTNGTGSIESMSLSQLRQYKLDQFDAEEIPTLDDIIAVLKQSDVILVFEIKSGRNEIVDILKEKLEKYDFWEQTVVISFNTAILGRMKTALPEVPTANLNTATAGSFAAVLYWMGLYNTGVDTSLGNATAAFNESYLRDRGIIGWYWTYDNSASLMSAQNLGYVGLTNNAGDSYKTAAMFVEGIADKARDLKAGDAVDLKATLYTGEEKTVYGSVFQYIDKGEYYEVIASYRQGNNLIYTQSFRLEKDDSDEPPVHSSASDSASASSSEQSSSDAQSASDSLQASSSGGADSSSGASGCGGCKGTAVFPAVLAFAALAGILVRKKRG